MNTKQITRNSINEQIYVDNIFAPGMEFLDFYFNNKKASDLGIVRIFDGDRYNINLTPELQNSAIDVPNGDGQYYYGTNYQARKISISFAFEALKEGELKEIKQWLNISTIGKLYLSETPDRFYYAKVTGTSEIKHLCFIEQGQRVYKGTGEITFTCFYPFSQSEMFTLNSASLNSPQDNNIYVVHEVEENKDFAGNAGSESEPEIIQDNGTEEDAEEGDILLNSYTETYTPQVIWSEEDGSTVLSVYNEGDLPMPLILTISGLDTNTSSNNVIYLYKDDATNSLVGKMQFNGSGFSGKTLIIDNREGWIRELSPQRNNPLANERLESGDFFVIEPQTKYKIMINNMTLVQVQFCFIYK